MRAHAEECRATGREGTERLNDYSFVHGQCLADQGGVQPVGRHRLHCEIDVVVDEELNVLGSKRSGVSHSVEMPRPAGPGNRSLNSAAELPNDVRSRLHASLTSSPPDQP